MADPSTPSAPGATQVTRNDDASRFELSVDGHRAELLYRMVGPHRLVLIHTEVPEELGGRGLGGALVQAALDYAIANDLTVVPRCPFAAGWLRRHPDVAATVKIAWPHGSED